MYGNAFLADQLKSADGGADGGPAAGESWLDKTAARYPGLRPRPRWGPGPQTPGGPRG